MERVVNNKFSVKDLAIRESKSAKSAGDPAQSFTGGVGNSRMRISVTDRRPIGVVGKKDKLCIRVDEVADQPWTSDTVDFHVFARDPFHQDDAAISGKRL
jgi:hypothetical protein